MNVLITGSSGLIGSRAVSALADGGHTVTRLKRSGPDAEGVVRWDPQADSMDVTRLEGTDATIHLAGESISEGRWTQEKKRRILESRTKGTRLLAESLARLSPRPAAMICASAVGYYGDRGDELLTEESRPGSDFLAEVCKEWEAAADPAREAGIRVVHLRFGIVLSSEGGALGRMLPIFKLGLGGKIGDGRQYWSWAALDDVVGAMLHALANDSVDGSVNVGSPNPVHNEEFVKTLGRVLNRPVIFPLPAPAARLTLGEVADALLLASARMEPAKLKATGYEFHYPHLENALRDLLRK